MTTSSLPADAPESRFLSGVILAIVGTFLFALKSIIIKLAFSAGATAEVVLTFRMLLALPFYLIVLIADTRADATANQRLGLRQVASAMSLGFLGYYLASFLDLKGLELISAQLERLTLFTYPAMTWSRVGGRISRFVFVLRRPCQRPDATYWQPSFYQSRHDWFDRVCDDSLPGDPIHRVT